ncbi:MAG: hypothetical protein AAF602_18020 [Myxococcota bacterium]
MIPARLTTIATLTLTATACTTQAVDDSIDVSFDIVVPDVDLNCVQNLTDETRDEQRSIGLVVPTEDGASCIVAGYFRDSIVDFRELAAELPGGVRDFVWTDVALQLADFDVTVENVTDVSRGTVFRMGAAVGTESDIPAFEQASTGDDRGFGAIGETLQHTQEDEPGTLFASFSPLDGLANPVPLDALVGLLEAGVTTQVADSANLAETFNLAYQTGARDLYVYGAVLFEIETATLPTVPSDVAVRMDFTLDYTANAKINLVSAAQSLNETE